MRITRNQLRQLIQEELKRSLANEQLNPFTIIDKAAQSVETEKEWSERTRKETAEFLRRELGRIEDDDFESDVPQHIRSQINRKLNPSNMYVLNDFLKNKGIQYPLSQHESALVLGYLNEL
jgi:hypothetical protein